MPVSAAERARYQSEVAGWLNNGRFNGDVNALTNKHWRAVKDLRAMVHIRPPRQETPVPEAQRMYPCWLQMGDLWVSMGNMRHQVAGSLINDARSSAHNNIVHGLIVRVQSYNWQTPMEAAAALEAVRLRTQAHQALVGWATATPPVPERPTLTGARQRALQTLVTRPPFGRLVGAPSWLMTHLSAGGGAILGTRREHGLEGWQYDAWIEVFGEGMVRFAERTPAQVLTNIGIDYPRIAIWLRSEEGQEWTRMGRETPLSGADPEMVSFDELSPRDDWTARYTAAASPMQPDRARRVRREEEERYSVLFDALPRSRRSACRELFNELSRTEMAQLQVTRVDSTDELSARDYVRLSEELGRRALAGEEDDDVLKDNENDYPTESV